MFTDNNDKNYTLTYNSIKGNCKYITLAVLHGNQEPYYEILVITDTGDVYYKEFYAYGYTDPKSFIENYDLTDTYILNSSMEDNFVKLEGSFIGIQAKSTPKSVFDDIIVYDENKLAQYITHDSSNNIVVGEIVE